MRRIGAAIAGAIAICALGAPGIASANTGTVTCNSSGVVFSYDAHFGRTKIVTETVNGVSKPFSVPKYTAITDTWPVFGTLTVGATWSGGSIPTVTLVCPAAPPVSPPVSPPVAPPAVPPATPPATTPPAATPSVVTAPAPRISLRKKAGAKIVPAGSTVTYRLIVTVTGGVGHDVVVCDRLPDHMTYVSVGSATLQGGEACWDVGDLSGSRTLAFTARVDKGTGPGTLVNRATATSSNAGHARAHASIAVPVKHGVKGAVRGQAVKSAGVTG
jgi:uncharacterized repeat protein (TIGR01451 family)